MKIWFKTKNFILNHARQIRYPYANGWNLITAIYHTGKKKLDAKHKIIFYKLQKETIFRIWESDNFCFIFLKWLDYIKIKSFHSLKETTKRMKMQDIDKEKI